ncbi:MAG: dihydroorotate dehydrogenase electron transfer subunit [Planctomycetota bacterium]
MVKSTINSEIIANKPLQTAKSSKYFRMTLSLTTPIKHIIPGQFVNLKLTSSYEPSPSPIGLGEPLLRRPFTIFNAIKKGGQYRIIEIVYQVVGKGTRLMSSMKRGEQINVLGPLGNGFRINKKADVSILVAGGVGIAGLYLLLKELVSLKRTKIYLFIGAKTKSDLYLLSELRHLTDNIIISTEDGSSGAKGLITTLLEKFLDNSTIRNPQSAIAIYACGPSGMSEAIRKFSVSNNIPAQISLEEKMGCGIGLCRVCVCKTIPKKPTSKEWEYSTVCEDGPVFDARQLHSYSD